MSKASKAVQWVTENYLPGDSDGSDARTSAWAAELDDLVPEWEHECSDGWGDAGEIVGDFIDDDEQGIAWAAAVIIPAIIEDAEDREQARIDEADWAGQQRSHDRWRNA